MDYVPITEEDRRHMLSRIGVRSMEALLEAIPRQIPRAELKLPPPLSEPELIELCEAAAGENSSLPAGACFLGAGAYRHFIPSVVRYMSSRGEFLTAYTPYQAEASQGTLQAMYEFQSLLCDLTGMEVANASLYDGASALAEACILAMRETGRNQIFLSRGLHPEYRQTVQTLLRGSSAEVLELPASQGVADLAAARLRIGPETAAVALQIPNALGCVEEPAELVQIAHRHGALFIAVVNPISLGILPAPGSYGADVVVGEGQPLGVEMSFGGPYLGLFACRQALLRKVPGRIVGMTRDRHGRRGFVLTLQTREQHIRRSKATSNICTNEAMMALAAAVYLAALGKEGFRELAVQNLEKARYAHDQITRLPGVRPLCPGQPFFNEFAVEVPRDPEELNRELLRKGFLGGFALKRWDPALERGWLLCVTEVHRRSQIDGFAEAVKGLLR